MKSNYDQMNLKAEGDITALLPFIEQVLTLADKAIIKIGNFDQERISRDDFGFMASCYLLKHRDHLDSIRLLVNKRDASLVARSMIEGLCQLYWTLRDKSTRASMWKNFVYVHDMRLLRVKEEAGIVVDEENKFSIANGLKTHGESFFKSGRYKDKKPEELPPDPYRFDWTGEKVIDICKNVEEDILYTEFYSPYSDWHHWNFGGIGLSLKDTSSGIEYLKIMPIVYLTSVQVGIRCVVDTIGMVDWHFKFGLTAEIQAFLDPYRKWSEERGYSS